MLLKSDFIAPGLVLQKIQLPFNTSPIEAIGSHSDVQHFAVATDLNYAVNLEDLKVTPVEGPGVEISTIRKRRGIFSTIQTPVAGLVQAKLQDRGWGGS